MPFVVDASVAVSWYFADEQHPDALAVRERFAFESAIVPLHWWFEICNALLLAERRGRSHQVLTVAALTNLAQLPIIPSPRPDGTLTFEVARRYRLTFYDAAYLELAQRENLALATLDGDLAIAARREGVALLVNLIR